MPDNVGETEGLDLHIQRFSIHDGPGIRTTVFLKGCPLSCVWCHNPEGRTSNQQISFVADRCIGCGFCVRVCPNSAHSITEGNHVLDRSKCVACGECTAECYSGALECVGKQVSVSEVLEEVMRDKPFYDTSGGGMSLSGGEPLFQIDFAEELLRAAKDAGLHCCVETSGCLDWESFERVRKSVDLFLYDLKDMNDRYHKEFVRASHSTVLDNLRSLHDSGANIVLRLPLIPTLNDRFDHFQGVAALTAELPNLRGVEILPYHRTGSGKYARLGIPRPAWEEPNPPSREEVEAWVSSLEELGVKEVRGPFP